MITRLLLTTVLTLSLTACVQKATAPSTDMPAETLPIEVTFPEPGDTLAGTVNITGQARGTWYFEASFPVHLLDAKDNVILALPAQAQGDWMTTDWVPFVLEMTVPENIGTEGTLVLKKDNPSGLPEHDAEVRIPVKFE